jgi:hypothetical protein
MQFLRANTAVIVTVGPFVDVGDGFTPQTDIALSGNEAELIKHGSTSVVDISGATWAAVTNCRGYYSLTLTTSHTDTEGMLVVVVQDDSDCLPVKQEYMVLSEAAWDSMFVAKDDGFMDVNLKTLGRSDTQETEVNNLESACAAYSATRGLAGTALPAAVADAAGGLPISDAGELDLDLYLKSGVTLTGSANVADTATRITLTGGVAADNYYNGQLVVITGGTGAGQARTILSYLAAGTAATPTRDFSVAPDNTSTFVVIGADVPSILEAGQATAGGAATITFDATASTTADLYKNNFVAITGGTGAGQTRLIGAYSAGRVATVIPNWTTNPDATSIYQVLPAARVDVGGWAGTLATLSAGNLPNVNAAEVSEDSTAADDLELFIEALGTDNKVLISTDAQDLSTTLDVNTKTITNGIIVAATLGADCITSAKIADDAISAEHLNTGALTADAFAADALVAATFATDSIAADALAADALAEINAQVVDALATDTYAEPGQGAPAATASLKDKIGYLYKNWRNKKTQDATTFELYNDAAAVVDQKAAVSDDGTDATKGEIGTGP